MSGISVIICCYNSENRIEETLRFLLLQKAPPNLPWEIIVVNNASTDETKKIVGKFITAGIESRLRIVDEPEPGLSNARQKGIKTSRYDLLIFCDDDNHLESNYIEQAFQLMSNKPEIGIAGGWVKPKLPFYPGKWIEPHYPALAIGRQSIEPAYVDWVFGAGMIFRKKILCELNEKGIKLIVSGRRGNNQTSGDDVEMCQLARFIGYKIYSTPKLILYHKIEGRRLTKKSFIKSNLENLHATVHLYLLEKLIFNGNLTLKQIKLSLLRTRCSRILKAIPRLLAGKHSFLNFLEIYVGSILISWVLRNGSEIKRSFTDIKQNLDNGRRGL